MMVNESTYTKRHKPIIPNHAIYNPGKKKKRAEGQLLYPLLILFVPFRKMDKGETPEDAFERHVMSNHQVGAHHKQLQLVMQASSKQNTHN